MRTILLILLTLYPLLNLSSPKSFYDEIHKAVAERFE